MAKYFVASGIGAIAFFVAACIAWFFTRLQLQDIVFVAISIYFVAAFGFLYATDKEGSEDAR